MNKLPIELFQFDNIKELEDYHLSQTIDKELRDLKTQNMMYRFIILSGPSGVGKSRIASHLRNNEIGGIQWRIIKRFTTRSKRFSDSDEELCYVSDKEFENMENNDTLLYSEIYGGSGSKYGVTFYDLLNALRNRDTHTAFIIIGTLALTKILPLCGYVYLLPPSLEELYFRINNSDRIDKEKLFEYDKKEMFSLLALYRSTFFNSYPVSVITVENNREDLCALKITDFARQGTKYLEIPKNV